MISLRNRHRPTSPLKFAAVAALLLCSCGQKADNTAAPAIPENIAEVDSLYKTYPGRPLEDWELENPRVFVIRGVDMQSPILSKGKFIWAGDLSRSDEADSAYDGITLPLTGAIVTPRKKVLKILAGDIRTYIINGKAGSEKDFDALPDSTIQRALINGDSLLIDTRLFMDRSNPDLALADIDEGVAFQKLLAILKEKYGFDDIEEGSKKLGLPSPYVLEQIYYEMMRKNTNPFGQNL